MNELFIDLALKERGDNKKLSLITMEEKEYVVGKLQAVAAKSAAAEASKGASTRPGAATAGTRRHCRQAGGRRVGPARATRPLPEGVDISDRVIKESFQLRTKSDGTEVLCRKRTRNGETGYFPTIVIEELEARLQQEHLQLGHPGYEQLYAHVSCKGWLQHWRWHGLAATFAWWRSSPPVLHPPHRPLLPPAAPCPSIA